MSDERLRARSGGDARDGAPRWRLPLVIGLGVLALIAVVIGLAVRASARQDHVALASLPKPVSTAPARATTFRASRSYVATIEPWNSARLGPQLVSAYVGEVLVRPGAVVRRGDVLATLDCRESSAESKEVAARARALGERQRAAEHEATRLQEMTAGGFASKNEEEQVAARSASEAQEVAALKASLEGRALAVSDCVVRAPFAGEVSERFVDPGAFVRPGSPVVAIVDRATVRVVADVPEDDFAVIAEGTPVTIEVLATGAVRAARVTRRSPAADVETRTVRCEIDLDNGPAGAGKSGDRALPVNTTARLTVPVGEPRPAVSVPLTAAVVRGDKASLFLVEAGVARRVTAAVLGESGAALFLAPTLPAGARVVTAGRALLAEGDRVDAKDEPEDQAPPTPTPPTATTPRPRPSP